MSNMNNTSISDNSNTFSLPAIPQRIRFCYFLCWDILSLSCSILTLYFLLSDSALRRALNNHIFIFLLFIGLFYELIDVSWILRNTLYDTLWQASSTFYLFWAFFDYSVYSFQIGLFAWASIERHILIFHERWVSTRIKRFCVHYLPVVVLTIYYLIFYLITYYGIPCNRSFNDFLTINVYAPCGLDKVPEGEWDLFVSQVIPILIYTISSFTLIVRTIKQKSRVNQIIQWRKYRKMTIQSVCVLFIYIIFNIPWFGLVLAHRFGLPFDVILPTFIHTKLLPYNIVFLFPLVGCLSLAELRNKSKTFFYFFDIDDE